MPRYYDMDQLVEMIQAKADTLIEGKAAFLHVAKWLEVLPPADVVPKSEVERLQIELDSMRGAANSYKMHYENLAREIFTDIEFDIQQLDFDREETRAIAIEGVIANIKKKYVPQECPTCQSFVGCEQANWTGPCDDYKEEKQ